MGDMSKSSPKQQYDSAITKLWEQHLLEISKYHNDPESHPAYLPEFSEFIKRRTSSILYLGGDPGTYDFKSEWKSVWLTRMGELLKETWIAQKKLCKIMFFESDGSNDKFEERHNKHRRGSSKNSSSSSRSGEKKHTERHSHSSSSRHRKHKQHRRSNIHMPDCKKKKREHSREKSEEGEISSNSETNSSLSKVDSKESINNWIGEAGTNDVDETKEDNLPKSRVGANALLISSDEEVISINSDNTETFIDKALEASLDVAGTEIKLEKLVINKDIVDSFIFTLLGICGILDSFNPLSCVTSAVHKLIKQNKEDLTKVEDIITSCDAYGIFLVLEHHLKDSLSSENEQQVSDILEKQKLITGLKEIKLYAQNSRIKEVVASFYDVDLKGIACLMKNEDKKVVLEFVKTLMHLKGFANVDEIDIDNIITAAEKYIDSI